MGIPQVYEMLGKSVISASKKAQKDFMAEKKSRKRSDLVIYSYF